MEKRPNHRPPKERIVEAEALKDEYYTPQEVADLFKLHYNTIRRMIREGELPAEKIGRQWRIRKDDLTKFTAK